MFFSDEDFGERNVSIVLDDVESELVFIDHTNGEMSVRRMLETGQKTLFLIILILYFDHFQLIISGGEYPVHLRSARLRRRLLRHRQQQLRLGGGYHGEYKIIVKYLYLIYIHLSQNLRVTWSALVTATGMRRGTGTGRSSSRGTSRISRGRESCPKKVTRFILSLRPNHDCLTHIWSLNVSNPRLT